MIRKVRIYSFREAQSHYMSGYTTGASNFNDVADFSEQISVNPANALGNCLARLLHQISLLLDAIIVFRSIVCVFWPRSVLIECVVRSSTSCELKNPSRRKVFATRPLKIRTTFLYYRTASDTEKPLLFLKFFCKILSRQVLISAIVKYLLAVITYFHVPSSLSASKLTP